MRLKITHETHYRYDAPPASLIEVLRLTPCVSAAQSVREWAIHVSTDSTLRRFTDAFGNVNHTFSATGPVDELVITATGTVETEAGSGVVSGTREGLPLGVFLRESDLTERTPALLALAEEARAASDGTTLDHCHHLARKVNEAVAFRAGTTDVTTAAERALERGEGVCQDLAHVFIAAARAAAIPARYISGYQFEAGRSRDDHASHAWAEAYIPDLGWVGFDPTASRSPDESYVRMAVGLDYLSAAPVRGAIYGGGGEHLSVTVAIERAAGFGAAQRLQGPDGTVMEQSLGPGPDARQESRGWGTGLTQRAHHPQASPASDTNGNDPRKPDQIPQ